MIRFFIALLILLPGICYSQLPEKEQVKLAGQYTIWDSTQIIIAHQKAKSAVEQMNQAIEKICEPKEKKTRKERWANDPSFIKWLGQPERINKVRRRINNIHTKFQKQMVIEVTRENKGKCKGWISAWTIPFGNIKIRLCEDFFIYRTHLQEKVLVHEMGHETGILFHRRIHGCVAARKAALTNKGRVAKKSTENYAWLAMSYLGLECDF